MRIFYAEDAADLVYHVSEYGKSFIDKLPLFDAIEVGGERFGLRPGCVKAFSVITKVVNEEGFGFDEEEEYFRTITAFSEDKVLVVGASDDSKDFFSFIHGSDGFLDAFFYDGIIETFKKSFLMCVLYDRYISIYLPNILAIAGKMGDEDAAEMAKYARNHLP